MSDLLQVPSTEHDDPEEVASALDSARELLNAGRGDDAVRLVRLAAEKASDAGDDYRALRLARAAADLTSSLTARVTDPGMELQPESGMEDRQTLVQPVDIPPEAREPIPTPAAIGTVAPAASRPRQALRVSVLPSSDERNVLRVRLLGEHEGPEPGAREALLVAYDPDVDLSSRRD